MAVNKNFVVKNGLEVSTDLIFADASTEKVGIGSTIPATQLDVKGGIAVTDINATGVTTVVTLRGTTGIVTTIDAISLQATNLTISGVATGISVDSATNFYVSGITTTTTLDVIGTGNMPVGIITNAQGTNLNYSGIGTIANVIFTQDASGLGATVGAAVGVVTYYGDGVNLTNVAGQGVGIRTTGAIVGYGFTILNFIGAGNTFAVDGKTVDISIAGGGGGGSVSIGSEAPDSPSSGSLWYHTEYGRTFVYFDEVTLGIGDTAVWVDAAPFNQGGQFINKYGDNAYGAIGYTGGTTSQASVYFTGDPNTGLYRPSADHVGVVAGGTKSLEVNPNGLTVTGVSTFTGNVNASAKLLIGTTTEGQANADELTLAGAGHAGITVRSGTSNNGSLFFSDGTSGADEYRGWVQYTHTTDYLTFGTNATEKVRITSAGRVGINSTVPTAPLNVQAEGATGTCVRLNQETTNQKASIYFQDSATNGSDSWIINEGYDLTVYGGYGGKLNLGAYLTTGITVFSTGDVEFYGSQAGVSSITWDASADSLIFNGDTAISAGGSVTANEFYGDGSNLTGIAAGGSGEFNTSISGATQYDVTTSMATAYTANASSSHRTIVHSIHICNISASEASISGEMQASFSIAHNIPVPTGSAVELLKQPKVLGPSETIELQSDTASALEATIIVEYKEDTDFWDAQIDLTSSATMTDIYTSTTNPSVVQSILLANDDGTNDVKARVAWTDGSNNIQSYLCYDMVIPAESTVELCEKPKYLAAGYKLRGYANVADRLEITASGKQITS